MKKFYRMLSWLLAFAIVFAVLMFGYHVLRSQSNEKRINQFEYNIDSFRNVDQALVVFNEIEPIKIPAKTLNALAVDKNDNIYVVADSKILKLNRTGARINEASLASPANCITCDNSVRILVGTKDHIEVYDSSLTLSELWPSLGENAWLTSITTSTNSVCVADFGNLTVWQFESSGQIVNQIGRNTSARFIVPSPYFDVSYSPASELWVANTGKHRLEHYTPDGKLLESWGVTSMAIEGFSGCCNPSHFAIMSDGSFVTSEKGLPRVKIYQPDGTFLSVVAGPRQFNKISSGCSDEALIKDVTIDSQDRILVLDSNANAVRIFIRKIYDK